MELFIAGLLLGFVITHTVWILTKKHKGNLILVEGDEKDTYAFLELHEPIDNLKGKKSIHLKIERRTQ